MSFGFGFGLPSWQPLSGGFNPSSLFVGGVQGTWFDPSDPATLFEDTAGTTPCATPGGGTGPIAVGLMLDKSQGLVLGSELVSNTGGPFTSTTGWVNTSLTIPATPSVVNGRLRVTSNIAGGSNDPRVYATITGLTVGKCYKISYVGSSGTAAGCSVAMTNTPPASDVTGGTAANVVGTDVATSFIRVAAATTEYIRIVVNGSAMGDGKYVEVSSISVKELAGNHAIRYGGTTTAPELSARVNLLTYSEQFNNAAWTAVNATIQSGYADPFGGNNAWLMTCSAVTQALVRRFDPISFSGTARQSITAKLHPSSQLTQIRLSSEVSPYPSRTFDFANPSGEYDNLGNGWYRIYFSTNAVNSTYAAIGKRYLVGETNSLMVYVLYPDLRLFSEANTLPTYQRIADQYTYDSNGFPRYLKFDGIDDGMYTPANLNLSGTDKVTVFAGVRKLSDAASGVVTELSANATINAGVFSVAAPSANGANSYRFLSAGSTIATAGTGVFAVAPDTSVLTGLGNISGDICTLRRNGALVATDTTDQGTGNYGTYPLYIGSRGNASAWLNGYLYSAIVVGSSLSAAQISSTESWIAGKEGITL